jgi:hypothetical protein
MWSWYRPGVAQRVGRVKALLFHDLGTWRGWVVSSTPRPHFTPGRDPVLIVQEAGWAPGLARTGAENFPPPPPGIRSPYRPTRSPSLYRLSYPAHFQKYIRYWIKCFIIIIICHCIYCLLNLWDLHVFIFVGHCCNRVSARRTSAAVLFWRDNVFRKLIF